MDIIQVALSQLGIQEQGIHQVKYNTEFYGRKVIGVEYPWCVPFIWWCSEVSDEHIVPKTVSVKELIKFGIETGILKKDYIPQCGDIFIQKSKDFVHAGFVLYCEEYQYFTIEGNLNGKVGKGKHEFSETYCFLAPQYKQIPVFKE